MVPTMDRICREQQGPSINKTQLKGGGGGGGGGTYIFKVTLYKMLFKLYNSIICTFKCVYIYLDSSHKNENSVIIILKNVLDKQFMIAVDFHSMEAWGGRGYHQLFGHHHAFKYLLFLFNRRQKRIHVWNNFEW